MTGGVPGAETIADVTARMVPALREMASLAPGETGLVVSHGACIKSGLALLGLPPESEEVIFSMDNCGWATIAEHHGGRLRLGPTTRRRIRRPAPVGTPDFASDAPSG